MKKIGILAIGTMIFISVSCKKSTIEPEATYYDKPTQNINNNVAPPVKNAISDPVDENARVPVHGVINENGTPVIFNPNKTPRAGVRNDENVNTNTNTGKEVSGDENPYATTDRVWVGNVKNENVYPVPHNPAKVPVRGVRNDENVNPYTTTDKAWVGNVKNENVYPVPHNPAKVPVRGVRNDEDINHTNSNL